MSGRVWHHVAHWVSLVGQMCTSASHNRNFSQIPKKCAGDAPRSVCITKILHHCNITQDFQEVGPLKVDIGSDVSGASL